LFGVALHQLGELEQHLFLLAVVQVAPASILERLTGSGDGDVDIHPGT
jgi:hypothetical protein